MPLGRRTPHPPRLTQASRDGPAIVRERPAGGGPIHQACLTNQPARVAPTPPPTIWLLDEPECPAYGRFVREHAAGSLYHALAWRSVLSQGGFGRALYLTAMQGERVVGVLPLFEVSGGNGRRRLVSLPATPAAGTLAADAVVRWLLENRAAALAQHRGADGVFLRAFRRLADRAAGRPWPRWLRVPIAAVLAQAVPAEGPGEPGRVTLAAPGAQRAHQLDSAGAEWLSRGLPQLEAGGYAALRAAECDARGNVRVTAVWSLAGRNVHVLALSAVRGDSYAPARLLQAIARHAAGRGARQIDFPCPPAAGQLWHQLLLQGATQVSDEQPLALPPRP